MSAPCAMDGCANRVADDGDLCADCTGRLGRGLAVARRLKDRPVAYGRPARERPLRVRRTGQTHDKEG
jgi:hypothetical protein